MQGKGGRTLSIGGAFIRRIELDHRSIPDKEQYPFNLGVVRSLEKLELHPSVTYMVGENGIGKSTLMEGIAVACGFNPEGGTRNFSFSTRPTHSSLHEHIRVVRGVQRPRDGFFFRAESYYNLVSNIEEMDREIAPGPPVKASYGGKSLHEMSHGESFFAAFVHRFGGRSLYILDEPEAALSPFRQMAMLSRIHQLVRQGSQFLISTHSPILMAYPDSVLYNLTAEGISTCRWDETEHYIVTRKFLADRERMLKELM
jgi:predicted ATPase